ncbi:hypothetical protein QE152_g33059 [Popillia japonica]|uniref:Reverse transcriptase domain-containing protein n=1 Tax=Popillia japonica TaxID=7064 RepID=A0AAW1IYF7_POPJA
MSCEVITYSDDIAFVASSTKIDSKQILSQADNWFSVNSMKINEKKSKTLSQCGTLKYLGVHMNRHYTWTLHIEYLEEKLKDAIEAIRNAKEEKKRDVYFKKFHTKIAYATILWGNAKEAENIFKKQIEAVALLSGSTSVDKQVFKANNIMTLHSLYIQQCLRFVHKLRSDPSSHNQYLKDFLPATAFELYNLVPHNFYKYDFNEFKVIIKEVCLSASFYNIQDFIAFDWTTKIPQVNVSIQNSEIQTLNEQLDEAVNKIRKTYFAKFQSILTNGNKLLMCSDGELQEIFDKQKRTMSLFLNTSDVEQKVFILINKSEP